MTKLEPSPISRASNDDVMLQPAITQPWHLDDSIKVVRAGGYDWPLVDTGGDGPALVMLPGSVGTCEMFFKQIKALGASIRIISISYPAESDPEKLADGLAALMAGLNLPCASVLGSSFGSYWAQFFALRHPDRVNTLFLGNGFVTPEDLVKNPLFDPTWMRQADAAEIQNKWREKAAQAPDSELRRIQLDMLSGRQSPENLKSRFLGVIAARVCPRLPLDSKRIVIIDCEDDPLISARSRQAVRDHYAGATLCGLTTGGHYPHILNQTAYDDIIRQRLG
jgi:pimeloyl-ACP methyl ester carboxylesterase